MVIGGGASATMLLSALTRAGGLRAADGGRGRIVVVDPAADPGPGVPYRTPEPWHRMNVRARELSVDPADPDHFVRWLAAEGHAGGHPPGLDGGRGVGPGPLDFVPRRVFGRYLSDVWAAAGAPQAGHDVVHLRDRAVAVRRVAGTVEVALGSGASVVGQHVVIAAGLPPTGPTRFAVAAEVPDGVVVGDPWASGALERVGPPTGASGEGRAVLVGTGLTAVDVALTLCGLGWEVTAVSPVGSFPARHVDEPMPAQRPLPPPPEPPTASAVTHWVRTACRREPEGWQAALDLVRHEITGVWTQMTWDDRRRLARHAGAVWQTHRHRVAPEVADRLDGLCEAGQVRVERGWVRAVEGATSGAVVVVTDRRDGALGPARRLSADLVVNCAGPPGVADLGDPLVASLLADGAGRVDPLGLGLEVSDDGALVGADGSPAGELWLLGAMRRGTQLESTAVPDLRVQATRLAERLVAAAVSGVSPPSDVR